MDLHIKGKTGLVTGASSGIGRSIAIALGAEGVRLALTARRRDKLDEVANAPADGARVAMIETGGWDTHARQGTTNGTLSQRLADLAKALALLPGAMGPVWKKTVVVVVTEFGRTVAENGTGGTDHGTGGVSFVLGGRVNGGKVLGQWPTLANLYQGRDLLPTTDMRSIFKTVLAGHMGVSNQALESNIFPGSADAALMRTLLA